MKKAILILSVACFLLTINIRTAVSQEKPKPKKDTVNMDSNAKPTFYYAVEDEKPAKKGGKNGVVEISIIAGLFVLVIGGVSYFLIRRKKK
jgi:LPXTG-motif cell wall-anchored protein